MAELADAQVSEACPRERVEVRFFSSAPKISRPGGLRTIRTQLPLLFSSDLMRDEFIKAVGAHQPAFGLQLPMDSVERLADYYALVLEHNPGSEHGIVRMKVLDLSKDKRIEWECISTHPKGSPASAWLPRVVVFVAMYFVTNLKRAYAILPIRSFVSRCSQVELVAKVGTNACIRAMRWRKRIPKVFPQERTELRRRTFS